MLRGLLYAAVEGALCHSGSGSSACWRNSATAEPPFRSGPLCGVVEQLDFVQLM